MSQSLHNTYRASIFQEQKLNGVSTIDFHITAKCSQACPYCWGPRLIGAGEFTRIDTR